MNIDYFCVSNCVSRKLVQPKINTEHMNAKVSIYLDKRVSKGTRLYPVKIRVTFNRERRYYGIDAKKINDMLKGYQTEKYVFEGRGNYSIDKDAFKKATGSEPRGIYKELKEIFNRLEIEYQDKADTIKPFSFDSFANSLNERKAGNDVFGMFETRIRQLEEENRIGTSDLYGDALKSLKEFSGKNSVPFEYFRMDTIKRYEKWILKKGNSINTLGMYLRNLRAIFNVARKLGVTDFYPFGRDGYTIKSGKGRKIALDTLEIKKIFGFTPDYDPDAAFFVDCWKLMYLLNGINTKDLVLLKNDNIVGNFILFIREKTKNTAKEKVEIKINLSQEARDIFDRWKELNVKGYLLPVLDGTEKEKDIKVKVDHLVRSINYAIKKTAKQLEIDKKVSCYTARHSWATQMMRHGAPVSFIGKQLGHMNSSSTDSYLNSFEDDTIIQWQKKVTEF